MVRPDAWHYAGFSAFRSDAANFLHDTARPSRIKPERSAHNQAHAAGKNGKSAPQAGWYARSMAVTALRRSGNTLHSRAGVPRHPPYGEAHPAVHFRALDGRVLSNTRPRVRPGACADPRPQHCDQASFSSWIRFVSPCAWAARSDTALAASPMASALCLAMSLTWTMDWLISSLAADCSSLAVAMALT